MSFWSCRPLDLDSDTGGSSMFIVVAVLLTVVCIIAHQIYLNLHRPPIPVSVNYHFSRLCNYGCTFCFHTAKNSKMLPIDEAKRGLALLKARGMRKLNFAGGEPFLFPKFLGSLLKYCKEELALESISIVSNGSKITEAFLRQHGKYIDILAISCDSFDSNTNRAIGRTDSTGNTATTLDHIEKMKQISRWCHDYGIMFKLNSVICRLNWQEDMADHVEEIAPFRWKVFQVLIVPGENDSEDSIRDARALVITDEQYADFCRRHRHVKGFVPESNDLMAASYLILDENMQFLDNPANSKSDSILSVGVEKALKQIQWDQKSFFERGGLYEWSKDKKDTRCANQTTGTMDW